MSRFSRALLLGTVALLGLGSWGCAHGGLIVYGGSNHHELRAAVGVFYDALAPHGRWFYVHDHGWVWSPFVPHGWRPYFDGYWAWTEYGWTWFSHEPWGWAPYHYGRWFFHHWYGWVWVPGWDWGPAWVRWRHGGGWIGWAPLPPQAGWRAGIGLEWREGEVEPDVFAFCFVETRVLIGLRPHYIAPSPRNVTLFRITGDATDYAVRGGHVFNRGVAVERIEEAVGRRVRQHRLVETRQPRPAPPAPRDGEDLPVYRVPQDEARQRQAPRPRSEPEAGASPSAAAQAVPRSLERRHDSERRELEQYEQSERRRLTDEHARERTRPPDGVSSDELGRRHTAEREALETLAKRERELLQERQGRERNGDQPAPKKRRRPRS